MKKKIVALLTAGFMLFSPVSVFADEKDDRIVELESQIQALEQEVAHLKEQIAKYENPNSVEIEQYLLDSGVLSGERIEMAADLVGAISGFKYGNAEIYEYDVNSDQYKSLASGGSIGITGFDGFEISAAAVNDKYVLIGDNLPDQLITAFKEFK